MTFVSHVLKIKLKNNRDTQQQPVINVYNEQETEGVWFSCSNLIVSEDDPQLWFDNGVSHQQILHLLHFLFALLRVGVKLSPHRKVLEQFE